MILFFRVLITIFISSFKPRIDPFGTSVIRFRVWLNDLDLNNHMNSGRYVSFMDLGRLDLLVRMRLLRRVMKKGWRPIAGGTMIRYSKSLVPFERFTLRSRLVTWDEKWFYFEHVMENAKGEIAASAFVRGLLRGRDGNVAPADFIAMSERPDLQAPTIPDAIVRWNEAEAMR